MNKVELFKAMIKKMRYFKRNNYSYHTCTELIAISPNLSLTYSEWLSTSKYFKRNRFGVIFVKLEDTDYYGKIKMFKEFLKSI